MVYELNLMIEEQGVVFDHFALVVTEDGKARYLLQYGANGTG